MFFKIFLGKSKTFQDSGDLTFPGITVLLLKFMVELGIVVHQFLKLRTFCMFHGQLQASNPCLQIQNILLDRHKFLKNGSVAFHFLMLCQTADSFSFGDDDLTVIGCQLSHNNL